LRITDADVLHVAGLARLNLEDSEISSFRKDLSAILDYMDMLTGIDTSDVEPTFNVRSITNALREDASFRLQTGGDSLLNAPKAERGVFVVPKVIEQE